MPTNNPHPPLKTWVGKTVFYPGAPQIPGYHMHHRRLFKVIDSKIDERGRVTFQLQNRWETRWTNPVDNLWPVDAKAKAPL